MTKAEKKKTWSIIVNTFPEGTDLPAGHSFHDFVVLVTRDLPIVYAELPEPRFQVLTVVGARGSYRCMHIWKTSKFVPLTASKVFATKKPTAESSKKKRVLSALRLVIKPQVDGYKAQIVFPVTCALTGKQLLDFSNTHLDHYKLPFIHIVQNWLQKERRTYSNIPLGRDGLLSDQTLVASFYRYHMETCDFKLVDKFANMKKGSKLV